MYLSNTEMQPVRQLMLDRLCQMGLVRGGHDVEAMMEAGVDRVFMPHGKLSVVGSHSHTFATCLWHFCDKLSMRRLRTIWLHPAFPDESAAWQLHPDAINGILHCKRPTSHTPSHIPIGLGLGGPPGLGHHLGLDVPFTCYCACT